jgi:hypothetical protein
MCTRSRDVVALDNKSPFGAQTLTAQPLESRATGYGTLLVEREGLCYRGEKKASLASHASTERLVMNDDG